MLVVRYVTVLFCEDYFIRILGVVMDNSDTDQQIVSITLFDEDLALEVISALHFGPTWSTFDYLRKLIFHRTSACNPGMNSFYCVKKCTTYFTMSFLLFSSTFGLVEAKLNVILISKAQDTRTICIKYLVCRYNEDRVCLNTLRIL